MLVKCEIKNGIATCVLKGRLDTQTTNKLEAELLGSVSGAESIIFDMEEVDYISSNFLRLCGKAAKDITSSNLSFINVSDDINKILKVTGLSKFCKVASYKDI
ncbi:MAG: STAS domain-containing protein [bacterium]|nr:STAS domain-containing protein [bacterium]